MTYVVGSAANFTQDTGATTIPVTLGAAVAVGDVIVGMVGWDNNATNVSGVADSLGNSYTLHSDKIDDTTNNQSGRTWRSKVTVAGTPVITVTFTQSADFRRIIAAAWSGLTVAPFDTSLGNTQATPGLGTDAVTSTAITTAENNELCVGFVQSTGGTGGAITAGTNYVLRNTLAGLLAIEDRILAPAGSVAATFTHASADTATITHIVALKPAPGPFLGSGSLPLAQPPNGSIVVPVGTKLLLVVALESAATATCTATIGGNAMSVRGSANGWYYANYAGRLFYYINPPTGIQTLALTGATVWQAAWVAYDGIDTAAPFPGSIVTTIIDEQNPDFTATIASALDEIVITALGCNHGAQTLLSALAGVNDTIERVEFCPNYDAVGFFEEPGAASVTMDITSTRTGTWGFGGITTRVKLADPPPATKLYFRDEAPLVAGPASELSGSYPDAAHWTNVNNSGRRMQKFPGDEPDYAPGLWETAAPWVDVATENEDDVYFGAFVSDPLSAQTISAGDWTLAVGAYLEDQVAGQDVNVDLIGRPEINIYRPSTSSYIANIDGSGFYSGTRILDNDTGLGIGQSHVVSASSIAVQAGDVIVVEVWLMVTAEIGSSGQKDCTVRLFFGGTQEPIDGEVVGSEDDVASYLSVPGILTFEVPAGTSGGLVVGSSSSFVGESAIGALDGEGADILTPTPVVAAFTIPAPTVVKGVKTLTPTPVVSTFTTTTPTLIKIRRVLPTAVAAVFLVTAPVVVRGTRTLTPTPRVAAFTVTTPVVSNARVIQPTPRVVAFTVTTPVVVRGVRTLTPTPRVAAFTVTTPVVVRGVRTVAPSPVVAAFAITTPTLIKTRRVFPTPVVAAMSITAPVVVRGALTRTPTPVVVAFTVTTPVVVKGVRTLTPSPTVAAFTVVTPAISTGNVKNPQPVVSAFVIATPVVVRSAKVVTPTPVVAALTATTPTVVKNRTLTPTPRVVAFTVTTPVVVRGGRTLTPTPRVAAFTVTTPVVIKGSRTITPTPSVAAFTVTTPTVTRATIKTPTPVVSAFTTTTPVVVRGIRTLTPTAIVAALTVTTPRVIQAQKTTPVVAAFTMTAPVVLKNRSIAPAPVVVSFAITAPTVLRGLRTLLPTPVVALFTVTTGQVLITEELEFKRLDVSGVAQQMVVGGVGEERRVTGTGQSWGVKES